MTKLPNLEQSLKEHGLSEVLGSDNSDTHPIL